LSDFCIKIKSLKTLVIIIIIKIIEKTPNLNKTEKKPRSANNKLFSCPLYSGLSSCVDDGIPIRYVSLKYS